MVDPIIDIDAYRESKDWTRYITPKADGDSYYWFTKYFEYAEVPTLQDPLLLPPPPRDPMDYTVEIRHRINDDSKVMYWGDKNKDGVFEQHLNHPKNTSPNIYTIKSEGTTDGAVTRLEVEVAKVPPSSARGALYARISADILSGTTVIDGGPDEPGIATHESEVDLPITVVVGAQVTGKSNHDEQVPPGSGNIANVKYGEPSLDAQSYVDFYKTCRADFSYDVNTATHTASTTLGPGDGWGTPDLSVPECTVDDDERVPCNIVYYDTNGTSITLSDVSGKVTGCGILVIDGDLDISGDFEWYGTIIVTEDLTFSGDGDQKIQGAVVSGGDVTVTAGVVLTITYDSDVTTYQKNFHPLCILSWRDGSLE